MLEKFVALNRLERVFRLRRLVVAFAAVALCGCLLARAAVAGDNPPIPDTKLGGFNWGLGLAADFDIGGKRVNNAMVANNNIVRATDTSNNVDVSFVLEMHYFLVAKEKDFARKPCTSTGPYDYISCTVVATGPFVAIEIGGGGAASGVISGYALGWMVGLQHPNAPKNIVSTWNLGIGLRVDPQAKVLGDGLTLNQPLPVGDTLRIKTEPRLGVMLLSSFSF